jgi:hypothetical protein
VCCHSHGGGCTPAAAATWSLHAAHTRSAGPLPLPADQAPGPQSTQAGIGGGHRRHSAAQHGAPGRCRPPAASPPLLQPQPPRPPASAARRRRLGGSCRRARARRAAPPAAAAAACSTCTACPSAAPPPAAAAPAAAPRSKQKDVSLAGALCITTAMQAHAVACGLLVCILAEGRHQASNGRHRAGLHGLHVQVAPVRPTCSTSCNDGDTSARSTSNMLLHSLAACASCRLRGASGQLPLPSPPAPAAASAAHASGGAGMGKSSPWSVWRCGNMSSGTIRLPVGRPTVTGVSCRPAGSVYEMVGPRQG